MNSGKRLFLARGKGYLNATGPQARFIIFLIVILAAFKLLDGVFQKLAQMLPLSLFYAIALVSLFVFIGIVGTVYSHKFLGPVSRIRRAVEQMAEGDLAVNLRLRESDDPLLKDLVKAISLLCEHARTNHIRIEDTSADLFSSLQALQEKAQRGIDAAELKKLLENVRRHQELLDKAIKAFRKM